MEWNLIRGARRLATYSGVSVELTTRCCLPINIELANIARESMVSIRWFVKSVMNSMWSVRKKFSGLQQLNSLSFLLVPVLIL